MLRDLVIAASLANLCYFPVWGQLLPGSPLHYFLEVPPSRMALLTAAAGVAVLTLIFFVGATLVRRSGSEVLLLVGRLAFIGVALMAANGIRRQAAALSIGSLQQTLGRPGLMVVVAVIGIIGLVVVARSRWATLRGVAMVLAIFSPFALLTFGRAAWAVARHDQVYADFANGPFAARKPAGHAGGRVVWFLFDEMDYHLAFEKRPGGISLPQFDAFRAQSVSATQAYPPAGETFLSIPSLATGKQVARAEPAGPRQLDLVLAGSKENERLNGTKTIFSEWNEAGGNVAAVGFYHPYCRLFADSVVDCAWATDYAGQARKSVPGLSIAETAMIQLADVVDGFPGATRLGIRSKLINLTGAASAKRRALGVQRYERILAEAKRMLGEPGNDLVYAHFPVPHGPNIYDRSKGELVDDQSRSYADNLELADRTLGELRRIMEANGTWDASTVLITSDHWYRYNLWKPWKKPGEDRELGRTDDFRVPMMLKLAGQQEARSYERPFTTTTVSSMLRAVGGEIQTPDDVGRWLGAHATYSTPICGRNSACGKERPVVPGAEEKPVQR